MSQTSNITKNPSFNDGPSPSIPLLAHRFIVAIQDLNPELTTRLRENLPDFIEIADIRDLTKNECPQIVFKQIYDTPPPAKNATTAPSYLIFAKPDAAIQARWIESGATGCYDLETYDYPALAKLLAAHAKTSVATTEDHDNQKLTATFKWNASLKITQWTESAKRLFGYDSNDAIGKVLDDWFFPAEDIRSVLTAAAATGELSLRLRFSCRVRCRDGSLLRSHWHVRSIAKDGENSPHFHGTCQVTALVSEFLPRKGAETALNESRIDHDNEHGLWDHRLANDTLFWSPSIFKRFGWFYGKTTPSPRLFIERVHWQDRRRLKRLYLDCVRGRSSEFTTIYRIQDAQNKWRFYQANVRSIADKDHPAHRRIVGSDFDITLYVDTAEELKFAKLTVDSSNAGVLWVNNEGKITYCNHAAETLLQYSSSEFSNLDFRKIDPDLFARSTESRPDPSPTRQTKYERKSGEILEVEVDSRTVDNCGETILILYVRDISQRKSIEREIASLNRDLEQRVMDRTKELASANQRLRQEVQVRVAAEEQISHQREFLSYLLEKLPIGVYVKEAERDFSITIWNAEMERLFRTSKTRILEQNLSDVFDDPILVNLLDDTRRQEIGSRAIMPRLKGQSTEATPFVADITRAPIHNQRGKLIAMVGIVQDVTERINSENRLISAFKELEDSKAKLEQSNLEIRKGIEKAKKLAIAAQASNRAKSYFMSNISHELRTPLNSIIGLTQVMLEKTYGNLNDKQIEHLELIEENGTHLESLITDILDLSKIELGKLTLSFDAIELAQIAEASIKIVKQQATAKNVKCSLNAEETTIEADPRRVRQVLINLLENAIKFSPTDSEVTIRILKSNSNYITIEVRDHGIGIDPSDFERVFQPFSQIDNRLARQYEGTGLGLAIVHKLIELHGGSISVESELGQGSIFSIRLPIAQPKAENNDTIFHIQESDADQRIVAVVDENKRSARLTCQVLADCGYRNVTSTSPDELLANAPKIFPKLVLVDLATARNTGSDWIFQLQKQRNWEMTTWIALSTLNTPSERQFASQARFTRFLAKPISKSEIDS